MKASLLTTLLASLFLSGCVTIPQDIKGNTGLLTTANYRSINQDISRFKGQEVRLGGRVLNVVNTRDETLFEIAVLPLDDSARPLLGSAYQGRIIVKASKFIEPLTLKDHLVTVLGNVVGTTDGKVGQAEYKYLTLSLLGYQVWQIRDSITPVNYPPYGMYGPGSYWRDGYGWGPGNPALMSGWGWYPGEPMFQIEPQVVE
ncbi:Slp family lipoprotein [Citrobacter sp. JGM124]|uniref:Slp family lipoprotein n=1 Tax=Citrobacter sp. JGM124 TaxID=2799789 RepID=UPI001BA4BC9B|nr:Slp family lipoprotein [Citrobacter sp. JGM124]MBS0847426.1 Slp family lipoprotein [Citrobacter sp. JGM124]